MAVLELYEQELITEESALVYCTNKGVVSRGIDRIKKASGNSGDHKTLKLDLQYGRK
jgi:twitching motility protein PilT